MRDLFLLLCQYPFDPKTRGVLTCLLSEVSDWDKTVRLINAHGIIALAAYNIKEARLEASIPKDAMIFLENGYMKSITRNTWLTERWKEVNAILTEAGIKHILLKGMALEHTLYGSRGLRQMHDNDILIKPEDSMRAWQLFKKSGFTTEPLKSPLFRKLIFDVGQHLPALYKDGYMLEIHNSLDPIRHEESGREDIWYNARQIQIGDIQALILPEDLHIKFLISHFDRHRNSGECPLRLYTDIKLLDKSCQTEIPDTFIENPLQSDKTGFRRYAYKATVLSVLPKYRLRFIIGDTFPTLEWMKKRYGCSCAVAIMRYVPRVWKVMWLWSGEQSSGSRDQGAGIRNKK